MLDAISIDEQTKAVALPRPRQCRLLPCAEADHEACFVRYICMKNPGAQEEETLKFIAPVYWKCCRGREAFR